MIANPSEEESSSFLIANKKSKDSYLGPGMSVDISIVLRER